MTEPVHIKGNILTPSKAPTIICHQVNCMGVMGAGLAKQIRDTYPSVYQHYRIKCYSEHNDIGMLGKIQLVPLTKDFSGIANLFGQYQYGRNQQQTNYDALRTSLNKLANVMLATGSQATVRIPYKMGCGLAGGKWDIVLNIIHETLCKHDISVEIWEL